ncbi:hypothetical protein GCM10025858_36680 [Alicyclobacillus sacchari]|nr:hypothetical protein GCM10025858_36680 [Alicyclobacillus sacchari]
MSQLTSRQRAILEFIRKNVREKGYPPSVREIGEAVGLASSSTVHGHLERLQQKGYLRRDPTKPRALELISHDEPTQNSTQTMDEAPVLAPIVGHVTAGLPITAIEDVQGYLPLPRDLAKDDEVFVLQIVGESMIEASMTEIWSLSDAKQAR